MSADDFPPKQAGNWMIYVGRSGYVAKGIVYATVGILALLMALGVRSNSNGAPDQSSALDSIADLWFGKFLLIIIGLGLFMYAVWKWIEAYFDPANNGTECKAVIKRIAFVFVGLSYAALAFEAFRQAAKGGSEGGNSGGGGGGESGGWTSRVMSKPFGKWIVGIIGGITVGYGLYCLYKAISAKFVEKLQLSSMKPKEKSFAIAFGRVGYFAIFVTTTLTGVFIIQAAVKAKPNTNTGLSAALTTVLEQPFGPWLLGVVAICLIVYGMFQCVLAKYRPVFIQNDAHNFLPSKTFDSQDATNKV